MAENFLAACALHDAWMLADTFCFGAASAETTNDIAIAAAIVDIRTFFMCCSSGKNPPFKKRISPVPVPTIFLTVRSERNPHAPSLSTLLSRSKALEEAAAGSLHKYVAL